MDSNKKKTRVKFSIDREDFSEDGSYRDYKNFSSYVRMLLVIYFSIFVIWLIGGEFLKKNIEGYYTPIYKNVKITSYVDVYDHKGKSTTPIYNINGICGNNYITLNSTDNDLVDIVDSVGGLTGRKLKYKVGNTYKMNVCPKLQENAINGVIIFGVMGLFITLIASMVFLVVSVFNIWDRDCICSCLIVTETTKAKISLLIYEVLSLLIPLIFVIYSSKWIYFWANI